MNSVLSNEVSGSQSDAQVRHRAVSLQYVALMLIILAFIAGTFSPRAEPVAGNAEDARPAAVPDLLASRLPLVGVFSPGGNQVSEEALQPLLSLLAQHDLVAKIELLSGPDDDPRKILTRVGALNLYLLDHGMTARAETRLRRVEQLSAEEPSLPALQGLVTLEWAATVLGEGYGEF